MTAIILAGGKASRMGGCDKAFLKLGSESLINLQLKALKKIFNKVIIVTNSPDKYRNLKGVAVICDIIPNLGPLGGIYSGLRASREKYNFVAACDMPFINKALIRHMIKKKDSYDIVIPKINGKFHPLFGVYSKKSISIIERLLRRGRLRVSNLFPKVKCLFISRREIEKFDKHLCSLLNINTKKDYYKITLLSNWISSPSPFSSPPKGERVG